MPGMLKAAPGLRAVPGLLTALQVDGLRYLEAAPGLLTAAHALLERLSLQISNCGPLQGFPLQCYVSWLCGSIIAWELLIVT